MKFLSRLVTRNMEGQQWRVAESSLWGKGCNGGGEGEVTVPELGRGTDTGSDLLPKEAFFS